jgi:ABC-type cobalamin/Fe3+-siderophores transport system ATPase subunit
LRCFIASIVRGERQRVLLSRALATESPVPLLDEPTTHLDPPHQVALARLFRHLASTHTSSPRCKTCRWPCGRIGCW